MNEDELKRIEGEVRLLWAEGANVDALVRFMRERGLNQPRSVDTLRAATSMDTGDAQAAILKSSTWRDQYERNVRLNDQLATALLLLSQGENPDLRVALNDDWQVRLDADEILNRTYETWRRQS